MITSKSFWWGCVSEGLKDVGESMAALSSSYFGGTKTRPMLGHLEPPGSV